jgi:hypothetical protein
MKNLLALLFFVSCGSFGGSSSQPLKANISIPIPPPGGSPFSYDPQCYVCCGTGFTAIPTCGAGGGTLSIQNYGANTVYIYPDGGTGLGAWQLAGTSSPTTTPGGVVTLSQVGIPYGCSSPAGAQTDGGCSAVHWNY